MNIFNTDKLVILLFISGTGGKFLANCLALSSHCVFQHADLALLQLEDKLSPQQKFDVLMRRLDNTLTSWNDLEFGDVQYFGNSLDKIFNQSQLKIVCQKVIDQNLFFVACFHDMDEVKITLKRWPNAKIILFVNDLEFLTRHRQSYLNQQNDYWQKIRGPQWPNTAPKNISEISQLPPFIQYELNNQFENKIYSKIEFTRKHVVSVIKQDNLIFEWDCDWYLDVESTVQSVEHVYQILEFNDYNATWIKLYWTKWIDRITSVDRIKK